VVKGRIPTRKIKHDEFASTISRWLIYLEDHARQALAVTLAIVVLIVLVLAGGVWLRNRSREASFALGAALALYREATVAAAAGPGQPLMVAGSYEAALDSFRQVAADYPRGRYGRIAAFYSGLCLMAMERTDEAVTALEDFLDRYPEAFHVPQARLALARLADQQGDRERALRLFREVAEQDSLSLPQPEALMELARFLELTGDRDGAVLVYERIQTEFPQSEFSPLAQQRSLILGEPLPLQ
jgi:tetratricopeptide (TPR) repeat protein